MAVYPKFEEPLTEEQAVKILLEAGVQVRYKPIAIITNYDFDGRNVNPYEKEMDVHEAVKILRMRSALMSDPFKNNSI